MNFPMIFCHWGQGDKWGFHQFILDDTGWAAFGTALAIGIVIAVVYYLIVGRNSRMANLTTWIIALIASLVVSYLVTDKIFVGEPLNNEKGVTKESITYKHSFFHAIEVKYDNLRNSPKYRDDSKAKEKISEYKKKLENEVKKGNDMVLSYCMSCVFWTLIFFVLASYIVKNWQAATATVPTYWPSKSVR